MKIRDKAETPLGIGVIIDINRNWVHVELSETGTMVGKDGTVYLSRGDHDWFLFDEVSKLPDL